MSHGAEREASITDRNLADGAAVRRSSHPGKDFCLVLDHTTSTERLGLVDEIHYATLCDGKPKTNGRRKEREEPKAKECIRCHAMPPPRTPVCPACGHDHVPQSKVKTVDGELHEVKRGKAKPTMDDKQQWWSWLLGYAERFKKSRKWCLAPK
jgi:hypothetical protein